MSKVIQVIPCKESIYTVYKEDNGTFTAYPVYYLGLYDYGALKPIDLWEGRFLDMDAFESTNYEGVFHEYQLPEKFPNIDIHDKENMLERISSGIYDIYEKLEYIRSYIEDISLCTCDDAYGKGKHLAVSVAD